MSLNIQEKDPITGELKSTGQMENAFWQHIGKVVNHKLPVLGSLYDEILANVERKLKGLKKHGFEQNKKTDLRYLRLLRNLHKGGK